MRNLLKIVAVLFICMLLPYGESVAKFAGDASVHCPSIRQACPGGTFCAVGDKLCPDGSTCPAVSCNSKDVLVAAGRKCTPSVGNCNTPKVPMPPTTMPKFDMMALCELFPENLVCASYKCYKKPGPICCSVLAELDKMGAKMLDGRKLTPDKCCIYAECAVKVYELVNGGPVGIATTTSPPPVVDAARTCCQIATKIDACLAIDCFLDVFCDPASLLPGYTGPPCPILIPGTGGQQIPVPDANSVPLRMPRARCCRLFEIDPRLANITIPTSANGSTPPEPIVQICQEIFACQKKPGVNCCNLIDNIVAVLGVNVPNNANPVNACKALMACVKDTTPLKPACCSLISVAGSFAGVAAIGPFSAAELETTCRALIECKKKPGYACCGLLEGGVSTALPLAVAQDAVAVCHGLLECMRHPGAACCNIIPENTLNSLPNGAPAPPADRVALDASASSGSINADVLANPGTFGKQICKLVFECKQSPGEECCNLLNKIGGSIGNQNKFTFPGCKDLFRCVANIKDQITNQGKSFNPFATGGWSQMVMPSAACCNIMAGLPPGTTIGGGALQVDDIVKICKAILQCAADPGWSGHVMGTVTNCCDLAEATYQSISNSQQTSATSPCDLLRCLADAKSAMEAPGGVDPTKLPVGCCRLLPKKYPLCLALKCIPQVTGLFTSLGAFASVRSYKDLLGALDAIDLPELQCCDLIAAANLNGAGINAPNYYGSSATNFCKNIITCADKRGVECCDLLPNTPILYTPPVGSTIHNGAPMGARDVCKETFVCLPAVKNLALSSWSPVPVITIIDTVKECCDAFLPGNKWCKLSQCAQYVVTKAAGTLGLSAPPVAQNTAATGTMLDLIPEEAIDACCGNIRSKRVQKACALAKCLKHILEDPTGCCSLLPTIPVGGSEVSIFPLCTEIENVCN